MHAGPKPAAVVRGVARVTLACDDVTCMPVKFVAAFPERRPGCWGHFVPVLAPGAI